MTGCGGDPTVSVTVKETLWWKESLPEGLGRTCVLRGNMTVCVEAKQKEKKKKS